jgi:hypothetical protein
MRHVESIPGMREEGIKKNDGRNEFKNDVL